ncbi:hypothetical protein Ais01nite_65250 [Asanoa ishikariensis]|uniref:Anti-sigma regulatory factor (Ser/Thr protein kinase) n=1 Tax=Asanoa ishikariensis TaxID=137265 RepID=A0A1H3NNM2_9ACTN|nr:ATP-binding protein [Asanoa ishikariensis]GIF68490.1 hypothetical protein Ais01nite_65250 [Asanoa ishikariensis]SDY90388.1 Anti-sigma regulatory factor (Ser/Thr protein kinase) [Asanoa ishikariensis]
MLDERTPISAGLGVDRSPEPAEAEHSALLGQIARGELSVTPQKSSNGQRSPGPGIQEQPLLSARFGADRIRDIRRQIGVLARRAGLSTHRADDFTVAVNEIMTNAIRHGGGVGRLYVWRTAALECEVRDDGPGFDVVPHLTRTSPPEPTSVGGMGLWVARRLCDTMSISSGSSGTVTRVSISVPLAAPPTG